jgi:hypothetical protein
MSSGTQGDSPTMDCPDVCLEALRLQEWEWLMEDCHRRSCWKNSIGVSVPRPCGLDVYVCSKSSRLCLTVVYWTLECNKVPWWIENPDYVTILWSKCPVKTLSYLSVYLNKIVSSLNRNRRYAGWHVLRVLFASVQCTEEINFLLTACNNILERSLG